MIPVLRHANRILHIDHTPLVTNAVAETYNTAEATAAASTLTVKNITGFAINQILVLEPFTDNWEIIKTHASTVPSGTTVTLASALVRTHPVGSKIYCLLFDQFELSNATTAAGSKTVLTVSGGEPPSGLGTGLIAVNLQKPIQKYEDREYTTGYYFARYKDSIAVVFGSYTGALIYGGWATNTVGYMIDRALAELGLTLSEKITKESCYAFINDCLKIVQGKQIRFPGLYEYGYVAGQTSRGINTITMPTNAYDTETIRSLVALRFGDNKKITFIDPVEYKERVGAVVTAVRTQATAGQTTLSIDNSYDFADAGSVDVYISGTKYTYTYTSVTRSATTGILNGIPASGTGAITVTTAVGINVWQNEEESYPQIASVIDGVINFYPLADASYDNLNEFLDYALVVTDVNSDDDTIDYARFDMVAWYLKWRVKMLARNDGALILEDPLYLTYKEALNDFIRTAPIEVSIRRAPRLNTMNRSTNSWKGGNTTTDES